MKLEKLGLHSHVLPSISRLAANEHQENSSFYRWQYEDLKEATVFDCRQLPSEFTEDTGRAEWHEAEALAREIRLPFPVCYFEFSDETGVLAAELGHYTGEEIESDQPVHIGVEFWEYSSWDVDSSFAEEEGFGEFRTPGLIVEGFDEPTKFFEIVNGGNPVKEMFIKTAGELLLGVLALLNDQLLATEVKPDPAPRLTAARLKKGKLPLSSETRVLTINTAAVRRAVSGNRLSKHESPRLHWRRGHWRVLHRGSEFEGRTWVKRCLVGDPSRGAIHKDYRLIWSPSMLSNGHEDIEAIA
jgi:hypothetical protein